MARDTIRAQTTREAWRVFLAGTDGIYACAKTTAERKAMAKYLEVNDAPMLEFFKSLSREFGPADRVCVVGHAGLAEVVKAAGVAVGRSGIDAVRKALNQ